MAGLSSSDRPNATQDRDDAMALCDEAIDCFMKGNFSRFQRTQDKLDAIKATTIRSILTQEENLLMQTEAMDFNERFRTEASGSSALLGQDGSEDEDVDSA